MKKLKLQHLMTYLNVKDSRFALRFFTSIDRYWEPPAWPSVDNWCWSVLTIFNSTSLWCAKWRFHGHWPTIIIQLSVTTTFMTGFVRIHNLSILKNKILNLLDISIRIKRQKYNCEYLQVNKNQAYLRNSLFMSFATSLQELLTQYCDNFLTNGWYVQSLIDQ